jgi:excisionase family DNA binding protein
MTSNKDITGAKTDCELMDVDSAASLLKLSKQTLYTWVSQKRIPHLKVGRRTMFSPGDIKAWLDSQRVPINAR